MVLKCFLSSFFMVSVASAQVGMDLESKILTQLRPLNADNQLPQGESKKEILLYFWATWCPECKEKLTGFFKGSDVYEKFDVYLVATDKEAEKIEHFQKKFSIKPQVVLDLDRKLQKELKVFSVPTTVLIERSGAKLTVKKTQSGGDLQSLLNVRSSQ